MRDLIERQAAIRKLKRMAIQANIFKLTGSAETVINCCIDVIERQIPSAQPEIIRCRNCKYWHEHKYAKETKRYIPFCGFNAIYTKSDDFCSRAERRTDAED